jgi:uncharacterized membrane protein YgdD (TMEM256/DUF423 family)
MTSRHKRILELAALSGLMAVAAGAFGAHLATTAQAKEWLRTGAQYQMLHAVAALVVISLSKSGITRVGAVATLFLAGGLVFAGTLYAMAMGAPTILGAVTPIGGLSLMAGWALLAWRIYSGADNSALRSARP